MARIRSLHPGLFTDEAFMALSMASRVLLVGIWTEADDHGVFEWKPLTLKARILPADSVDAAVLLAEIEAANIIKRDGAFGLIRNFCKYQRPKKPTYRFPFSPTMAEYVSFAPTKPEPVPHQAGTSAGKPSQMEDEGGSKKEVIRAVGKPTRPPDDHFEKFWKAYPSRGTAANPKAPARKLFEQAVKAGADPEAIIAAAAARAGVDAAKVGTEFIPQAVKWLRDRRWEDHQPLAVIETASQIFISVEDDRFRDFQARWRAEHQKSTGPPVVNGGWYFPIEWQSEDRAA